MKFDKLSTVVDKLESGRRPRGGVNKEDGDVPSLGGEHLDNDGGFKFDNLKLISNSFYESLKSGVIEQHDILIVKDGATTGKVSYVDDGFPYERAAINEHLFKLRINNEAAYPKYVYLVLKSAFGQKQILKDFRGAAIGGISRGFIERATIPLPPKEDQIRIATLLSRVEALIATRKNNLQQLDDFLKSTFLEMFGDPIRNEKGWETMPFNKVGKFVSGGTPSKKKEEFWVGEFPWVSPKDMKVKYIEQSLDHISESVFEQTTQKMIPVGSVLIVVRGMILAHSFPVAINKIEVAINQDMKAIIPLSSIVNEYLLGCLIVMKQKILSLITVAGHGTRRFDADAMKNIFIPIPPMDLQRKYSQIAVKIEGIEKYCEANLDELENLYAALSQKAFKGELNLRRIPLPENIEITGYAEKHKETISVSSESSVVGESLADPIQRNQLLSRWFNDYQAAHSNQTFSVGAFWQFAEQRMDVLTQSLEIEDSTPLGLAEYEQLKTWLFTQIEQGELTQAFSMGDKQISLKVKS